MGFKQRLRWNISWCPGALPASNCCPSVDRWCPKFRDRPSCLSWRQEREWCRWMEGGEIRTSDWGWAQGMRHVEKMHLSSDIGVISSPSSHPPLLHLHPCIMVFFVTSKGICQRHMRERQEVGEDEKRLTWNVYRGCWSVRASTHKHTFSHFNLCGDCDKLNTNP